MIFDMAGKVAVHCAVVDPRMLGALQPICALPVAIVL